MLDPKKPAAETVAGPSPTPRRPLERGIAEGNLLE